MHNFDSVPLARVACPGLCSWMCFIQIVEGRMRRFLIALAITLLPSFAIAAHGGGHMGGWGGGHMGGWGGGHMGGWGGHPRAAMIGGGMGGWRGGNWHHAAFSPWKILPSPQPVFLCRSAFLRRLRLRLLALGAHGMGSTQDLGVRLLNKSSRCEGTAECPLLWQSGHSYEMTYESCVAIPLRGSNERRVAPCK